MSSNIAGCALSPDGHLLDASHIQFFHDMDDDVLLPPVPSTSSGLKLRIPPCAPKVAGSRRADRIPKPSKRLIDPSNVAGLRHHTSSVKRKASCAELSSQDEMDSYDPSLVMTDDGNESGGKNVSATALGDADRAAMTRRKCAHTADVQTIFMVGELVNTDTKQTEKGHWCNICREKGISARHAFLKGSVSSLRSHIARHDDHVSVYKSRCTMAGIAPHPRALLQSDKSSCTIQTTLDVNLVRQPAIPAFTVAGLLDYVVELIVTEDEAFFLVDKGPFRQLLRYLRPSLAEKDLPHRRKVREEIVERARQVEAQVKDRLQNINGRVSFTFDTWTSDAQDPYFSITGHYISASLDNSLAWELHSEQLAFAPLEGKHSGANIAKIIARVIDRYNIRTKIGWFTADNASNNDTAIKALTDIIPEAGIEEYKTRRIRCMEHTIHLSVSHFIDEISPTPTTQLASKLLDESDDDASEFNVADAVDKAMALITQIRKSPQARAFFLETCEDVNILKLRLVQWVRTRWASLFFSLDRFLKLRKAVVRFVNEADDSEKVPVLKKRLYADYKLSLTEWEYLGLVHRILQEPAMATQTFSAVSSPSLSRSIPVLEFLAQNWEDFAADPQRSNISTALHAGLENLTKWYRSTGESDAYFIMMVLDPTIKLAYVKKKWSHTEYDDGLKKFKATFDKYYVVTPSGHLATQSGPDGQLQSKQVGRSSSSGSIQYGHAWMQQAIQAERPTRDSANPRAELTAYLSSPLEEDIGGDIVRWWGYHSIQYPTLARMARDYLAIQGSATPSERAFSSAGLTGTSRRNRLAPHVFEALQLLKAGYRNGHIQSTTEAATHASQAALFEGFTSKDTDSDTSNTSD